MKCLKCGGMQMLRCEHTGGGLYWYCPRCFSTLEDTSSTEDKPLVNIVLEKENE